MHARWWVWCQFHWSGGACLAEKRPHFQPCTCEMLIFPEYKLTTGKFSWKFSWKIEEVQTSAATENLVFFFIVSFLNTSLYIRCGLSSCCEPWSSTASGIFELGFCSLLSLYVCSFHVPSNSKYPLSPFSKQNTDNRNKARTICLGLEKSG